MKWRFSYGYFRYLTYRQWFLLAVLVNDEFGLVVIYNIVIKYFIVDLQPAGIVAIMVREFSKINPIGIFEDDAVGMYDRTGTGICG